MGKKIIVVLVGVLFLAVGIFMLAQGNDLAKRCTAETMGTVINLEKEESTDSDGYISYTYYPIFEYQVGEKTISQKGRMGSSNPKYHINDTVELLYDPDKPEDFVIKGDKSSNLMGIIFIVAGVALVAVGVIKKDFN